MKYFGQKGGSGGSGGGDTNPNITSHHSIFPEFNIQSVSSMNLSVVPAPPPPSLKFITNFCAGCVAVAGFTHNYVATLLSSPLQFNE